MTSSGQAGYRVRAPQVVHETVDGEVVAVDFASGSYYSLRGPAEAVWNAVADGASVGQVVASVAQRFHGEDLDAATETFLRTLEAEGLVEPIEVATNGSAHSSPPGGVTEPLGALTFEKFTDMEEIILLDPVHDVSAAGWPNPPEAGAETPA